MKSRAQLRNQLRSLRSRRPAPFIVGVTRSGTTLLRLMLDSHPKLAIPPETHFVPRLARLADKPDMKPQKLAGRISNHRRWGDFDISRKEFAQALRDLPELSGTTATRAFYDLYAQKQGKSRWGDKTPGYQIRMLKILKIVPEARFIHVIRDGRDVAISQARKSSDPTPLDVAGKRWKSRILATRLRARRLPDSAYLEVRYEDLILDTENELRKICEYLDLRFDKRMLSYHERADERLQEIAKELPASDGKGELGADARIASHKLLSEAPKADRVEAWRTAMSAEEIEAFEVSSGDLLAELGYPLASGVRADSTKPGSDPKGV